eukprot:2512572-Pyramimonas_sp.AAC.1
MGASWIVLGLSWAVLGPSWGRLRPFWGGIGGLLGGFGASGLRKGKNPKNIQKPLNNPCLLPLGALLGRLLEAFGAFWKPLKPSRDHRGRLGAIFGRLGALLDHL